MSDFQTVHLFCHELQKSCRWEVLRQNLYSIGMLVVYALCYFSLLLPFYSRFILLPSWQTLDAYFVKEKKRKGIKTKKVSSLLPRDPGGRNTLAFLNPKVCSCIKLMFGLSETSSNEPMRIRFLLPRCHIWWGCLTLSSLPKAFIDLRSSSFQLIRHISTLAAL